MIVRQAEQGDMPYIMGLYKNGLEELGETKFVESCMVNKIVTSRQLAPCFLLVIDGIIRGMLGLTITRSSHNGDAMLNEYMFYIQPEFRGLKHLSALVNKSKEFALSNQLPIKFDFVNQAPLEVRKRLLTMHGFRVYSVTGVYNDG